MTINSMITLIKISKMGDKPFYAKDVGMNGGLASYLSWEGAIVPTGKAIKYTIPHPYDDKMLIKCEVKEWKAKRRNISYEMRDIPKKIAQIEEALKLYHELTDNA